MMSAHFGFSFDDLILQRNSSSWRVQLGFLEFTWCRWRDRVGARGWHSPGTSARLGIVDILKNGAVFYKAVVLGKSFRRRRAGTRGESLGGRRRPAKAAAAEIECVEEMGGVEPR